MTSREYLSRLVRAYAQERYGVPETGPVVVEGAEGETYAYHGLEAILADFEIWRACHEVAQNERNSACLI